MKKIKILAVGNVAGKPVQPGDVIEAEDFAAYYLISIGKAEEVAEAKPAAATAERKPIERKAERKPAEAEERA